MTNRAILLFILAAHLYGCQKNNESNDSMFEEAYSIEQIIKFNFTFDHEKLADKSLATNLEIEWDNFRIYNIEGVKWYEFSAKNLMPMNYSKGRVTHVSYSLMVTMDSENKPLYLINKMSSHNGRLYEFYEELVKEHFTGTALFYNLKGEISLLELYAKGEVLNASVDLEVKKPNLLPMTARCHQKIAARCTQQTNCAAPSTNTQCGSGGNWELAAVGTSYIDWWYDRGTHWEYGNTTEEIIYDYVWVPSNTSPPPPASGMSWTSYVHLDPSNGFFTDAIIDRDLERIDVDQLRGYENCIFDKLTGNAGNWISELLRDLNNDTNIDIEIVSKNKVFFEGREVNGKTHPPENGKIVIEISTSKMANKHVVSVAKTIMHEIIHADMFRALNSNNQTYLPSNADFKDTYDRYNSEIFEATAQHNVMAELYLDMMASGLEKFHKKLWLSNYNHILNTSGYDRSLLYQGLAWRGLNNSGAAADRWNTMPSGTQQTLIAAGGVFDIPQNRTTNCRL